MSTLLVTELGAFRERDGRDSLNVVETGSIRGTVARCQRVGEKYRVGLQCEERLAA